MPHVRNENLQDRRCEVGSWLGLIDLREFERQDNTEQTNADIGSAAPGTAARQQPETNQRVPRNSAVQRPRRDGLTSTSGWCRSICGSRNCAWVAGDLFPITAHEQYG